MRLWRAALTVAGSLQTHVSIRQRHRQLLSQSNSGFGGFLFGKAPKTLRCHISFSLFLSVFRCFADIQVGSRHPGKGVGNSNVLCFLQAFVLLSRWTYNGPDHSYEVFFVSWSAQFCACACCSAFRPLGMATLKSESSCG